MDSTSPHPPAGKSPKALWIAIGVLGAAVIALGGTLLHRQGQVAGAPPPMAVAATSPSTQAPDDFKPDARPALPSVPPAGNAPAAPVEAPRVAAAQAAAGPGPVAAEPAQAAAPPPCAVCGHVESVHPVQRAQPTSGVGAVAGGVVGGLVGNQFGHGNGRVATTVLGAVGGGFAGNAVEKHVRKVTVYQVAVRMDNGSLRTVETKTAPPIGKPVTLRKGLLRPADGHK
ncbi:glycine zipper 2TM domain-containing protein [Variovorax sp. ZS18.2.2]|uniref:glycine zipper 2TM domain-containing protein n=1 Tax=Variovorax sp. ZS18.2.2 TaxID=2971255 RepID=UPI0021517404|nr:glycine zipper 2TM domain-containing protein [Variovorax sp. ZS18.2.2]MCR6479034.1 glycine zipper 2TM domain-containing protein [Variovorax sp. ZS18.2.2]